MQHVLSRLPLRALLAGFALTACGGTMDEPGLAPAGEDLGSQELAMCSGASVSTLTLSGISSYGGEIGGGGSWAVTYPANAVLLEYYVDGALWDTQKSTGSSGTWNFSHTGLACGAHTFEVKAWPRVVDSAGGETICGPTPSKTLSQPVTQNCPTANLSCSTSGSSVNCTGSGTGGTGGYTYFWQERFTYSDGSIYTGPWEQGTTSNGYYCAPATSRDDETIRISLYFKVRDSSGMDSPSRLNTKLCLY